MVDKKTRNIVIGILVIAVTVFLLFKSGIFGIGGQGTRILVKFYDEDKNLIQSVTPPAFAIVQDIPNVFYATFTVLAENIGDQTLTMWISGARQCNTADSVCLNRIDNDDFITYGALWNAFDFRCAGTDCTKQAAIGDTVSFGESDYIDLDTHEGTEQRYAVEVTGSYELPGTPYIEVKRSAWIDLTIKPDPGGAGFIVDIDSSAEGGIGLCAGLTCDDFCDGTTLKYQGYCDVGTGTCKFSSKANAPECGGIDPCAGVDCSSDCVGTTLYYAGYCDVDTGDCVYQTIPNSATCGGTGAI